MSRYPSIYDLYTLSYATGKVLKHLVKVKIAGDAVPRRAVDINVGHELKRRVEQIAVVPNEREQIVKISQDGLQDVKGKGKYAELLKQPQSEIQPEEVVIQITPTTTTPSPSQVSTPISQPLQQASASPLPPFSPSSDPLPSTSSLPSPEPLPTSPLPSSRLSRFLSYTSLSLSLSSSLLLSRLSSSGSNPSSSSLTPKQTELLVSRLRKMRGVALKFGQFMGLQEFEKGGQGESGGMMGEESRRIWEMVMDRAEGMMKWQVEKVLKSSLGPDYMNHFDSLSLASPTYAASLGQVHLCNLAPSSPFVSPSFPANSQLAIKIQYPGVKESIDSDVKNLLGILKMIGWTGALPRGLYLEKTLEVMKEELRDECDYTREGRAMQRMKKMLELDIERRGEGAVKIRVPKVLEGLTKEKVLVMEKVGGHPLGREGSAWRNQEEKDEVATQVLRIALMEIFNWRFMQTDPNWGNFLWDQEKSTINLIDFGASRTYSKSFTDKYLDLIVAAVKEDKDKCIRLSQELGYLTGEEKEEMVSAHISSLLTLAIPFRPYPSSSSPAQPFHFLPSTTLPISNTIRSHIPVMLANRLTPPPRETYSLNRKLAGVFLLCGRVGGRVKAGEVLKEVVESRVWWEKRIGETVGEWLEDVKEGNGEDNIRFSKE